MAQIVSNYTAQAGDTWDYIAFKFYRSERMSTELINANKKYIYKIIFSGGENIIIPIKTEVINKKSLPPWRR